MEIPGGFVETGGIGERKQLETVSQHTSRRWVLPNGKPLSTKGPVSRIAVCQLSVPTGVSYDVIRSLAVVFAVCLGCLAVLEGYVVSSLACRFRNPSRSCQFSILCRISTIAPSGAVS